jgi:putative RNA 2'-phosphotransferase
MDIARSREKLNAFLGYVLGRNPYEFGLVPDENGYVKIRDLLKAVREETGFGHVTEGSLTELQLTVKKPMAEIQADLIRATDRDKLMAPACDTATPKLLYIGIRTRAHGHALHKGLQPYDSQDYVILSSDRDMAERMGKRKDAQPVILTVNTDQAEDLGVVFFSAGENIYLARQIPTGCFSGPPLPSSRDEVASKTRKGKAAEKRTAPSPGSFFPDFSESQSRANRPSGKQAKLSWKHNKKKIRKQKEKFRSEY